MIIFPNAKINLGLFITARRQDGYHELSTCFYPVPWQDALECVEASETKVTLSGRAIPGSGDNLVLKAYHHLKADFDLPPVHLHLHKVIPIGAGLGGGSADAAFAIKLLNEQFDLQLSNQQLKVYAAKLGADCSFFIDNTPAFGRGIGDLLTTAPHSLQGKFLILIYPDIHIATAEAYRSITPTVPSLDLEDIFEQFSIEQWRGVLVNDFEKSLFPRYPELEAIKANLYDAGALYAAMSGSGSSLYGIFEREIDTTWPQNYEVWRGRL